MDTAEPAPSPTAGAVGMCYVVVTAGEPGQSRDDLRIRFEFRDDLTSGRSESRTVLGVGAACEAMREWLARITG
jgi:hypothetical protein